MQSRRAATKERIRRRRAIAASLAAGVAGILAVVALAATVRPRPASGSSSPTRIASITRSLARVEAELRRERARRPPVLPPLPGGRG